MSESIGHYEILGLVGTGSHGAVYRARDMNVGRTVAVRLLSGMMPDPLRRARCLDLIRPYTALSHPHVATLFEAGEHQGSIYLVYEFVPGDKLASLTAGRPMSIRRAVDLATQAADALAEAHALDLLHGALSPTSIIVTPQGHAKVLDFGLTAWLRDDETGVAGQRRAAAGTAPEKGPPPGYTAPEQLLGGPVDRRADLFALGALLHEMLTGEPPFGSKAAAGRDARAPRSNPAVPSALNPEVPAGLDVLVTRALAKQPAERYQSSATMAADLRTIASTLHRREISSDLTLVRTAARPSPWRGIALGSLLVAVALVGWQWRGPLRQAWQGRFGAQPSPLVVVLPFEVGGSDLSRPYFGAGFADDLARRMGHVPGLAVLGRSAIRTYAGKSPQRVAREVGASLAVSGRLTPADEDWRSLLVVVTLVDRESGRTVWDSSYTTAARDVMSLQAHVARDIANWLRVESAFTAEQGRAGLRLVDPGAYDLYLQARDAMAGDDPSRAAQLYESAIAADPSLLEAHTGLVEALYSNATFGGRIQYADVRARMRDAAEAAATTDPDLAPAQLAMGLASATIGQALEHFRKAIDLDRSYTAAYLAIADMIQEADPLRAIALARKAVELDPAQPMARYLVAGSQLQLGEFDRTLAESARGLAQAPSLPWWDALRVRVRLARPSEREPASTDTSGEAPDFPPLTILRAASLAGAGRRAEALALLAGLTRLYPASCEARAMTAAIRYQGYEPADGLRIAGQILGDAESSAPRVARARCAAMAAAAIDDGPRAAVWITRAASSEDGLRWWSAVNGVLGARASLRQRVFPWSRVAASRDVTVALGRLDSALARVRADAARILEGL